MRRTFFAVCFAVLVPLALTQAASTAVKAFGANVNVAPTGGGQYVATIQNTDIDGPLNSFTFQPGPRLVVTGVVRSDVGSCTFANSTFTCNALGLVPAQCECVLGGIVSVTFTGTGDGSGSSVVPVGTPITLAAAGAATNDEKTATKATTSSTKTVVKTTAKKVKVHACKKGQRSTKAKPCTKPKPKK